MRLRACALESSHLGSHQSPPFTDCVPLACWYAGTWSLFPPLKRRVRTAPPARLSEGYPRSTAGTGRGCWGTEVLTQCPPGSHGLWGSDSHTGKWRRVECGEFRPWARRGSVGEGTVWEEPGTASWVSGTGGTEGEAWVLTGDRRRRHSRLRGQLDREERGWGEGDGSSS